MNYEAININVSISEVSIYCDNLVDAYRKLKDLVEEWAMLVDAGLATNKDFDSFLIKSTELQDEMRENAEGLGGAVGAFREGLEDSGLPY